MNKDSYFESLNQDEALKNEVFQKYQDQVKKVVEFIKRQDKAKNPDADETENVVDVDCLTLPIIAALIDAHYNGMFEGYERNTKNNGN